MKIAFFLDSYKPYLSGVTNSAEILVNELRRLGHKVYIFAPSYPNHRDSDPDIFRFPSIASGYPNFRLALPFVKSVPEVDLVHSHSPFQAGLLAGFVARRRKVPLVYTFHTLFTRYLHYAWFLPAPLGRLGLSAYLHSFCRGADAIIAPSVLAKRVLLAWQVRRPVHVIPSGIELSRYPADPAAMREALRRRYRIRPEEKVLLYVGRLSKEKNLHFLIEAFARLGQPDVRLVLVGGGPLEEELRELRLKNVTLIGEIAYPEVLNYYSLGDIFVFASLTETQGMVIAEAKAAGLPVVALFAGGLIGTVRSGVDGYLVGRDLEPFISRIRQLLSDEAQRASLAAAAQADARARFSSEVVAKQVETVYNSLTERRRNADV
ncbi:MAG: glycosyltransferase [Candidatus Saganbacteria bacterium]|nr:glycosyltransferase [Candidatus Saganbacteria bacterium]